MTDHIDGGHPGNRSLLTKALLVGMLGTAIGYSTVPRIVNDLGSYLARNPKTVATAMAETVKPKLEPASTAIIANGIGSMDNSTAQTQKESTENAFEAYKLFSQHMKTDLFLSNPYDLQIPKGVKVEGNAETGNLLSAIRDAPGKVYIVLFSPQRPYVVGGTPEQMDPSFYLSNGVIYPRDLETSLSSNKYQKLLISNITNPSFTNGIFAYEGPQVGVFKVARPNNFTGIMLKDNVNFSEIVKRFGYNRDQSVEELFKPYFEGGSYVTNGEVLTAISQSPVSRASLFSD